MQYVVGVDGGATKTHALVMDETGRQAGFGQGGPSTTTSMGWTLLLAKYAEPPKQPLLKLKSSKKAL